MEEEGEGLEMTEEGFARAEGVNVGWRYECPEVKGGIIKNVESLIRIIENLKTRAAAELKYQIPHSLCNPKKG